MKTARDTVTDTTPRRRRGRPSHESLAMARSEGAAAAVPYSARKSPYRKQLELFGELGRTGLVTSSGYVLDDITHQLRGQVGMKRYREMWDNWSLITGIVRLIEFACRQVDLRVEPGGKEKSDEENAEFLKSNFEDMSTSWADTLSEIIPMVVYGFSPLEIVYKRRQGWLAGSPGASSKHNDGMIGWRKLAPRSPESVLRWGFDENGGIQSMVQQPAPLYQEIEIPIEKLLIFRTSANRGNPEGKSWLRGIWYDWYSYKRVTELTLIRFERDSTGIPVAEVPSRVLNNAATKAAWQDIVENLRQDEQAGLLFGQEYDPVTKMPLFKVGPMPSPGPVAIDPNILIQRHMQLAAIAFMADFVLLGHEQSGSWALADNKTGMFAKMIGGLLDGIFDVLNRHGVPRLWAINGLPMDRMATIKHGDLESRDFGMIADFLQKLSASGMLVFPNRPLEVALMESANLPPPPEETDTGVPVPRPEPPAPEEDLRAQPSTPEKEKEPLGTEDDRPEPES